MDATLTASRAVPEGLDDGLTKLLRELDSDAINWTPPISETNSIAVMVSHLVGATGRWQSQLTRQFTQNKNR